MARLFPSDLEITEEAQERLAGHLARILVPDDAHWIWYRPSLPVAGRKIRPTFVLLGPPHGLFVLEASWWKRQDIEGATDQSFRVRLGSGSAAHRPRPEIAAWKAAEYLSLAIGGIPGASALLRVEWGVAYPRLSREDVRRLAAEGVLDPARILARDDLTLGTLSQSLGRLVQHPKVAALDPHLRERIRAVVEPQIHFLDLREPAPAPAADAGSVGPLEPLPGFWLDRKQERIARELASPRTIVYGPAGSGKTVFLVARAQYWLHRHPDARVLYTCYNASLASHLRRVFAAKGSPADDGRLTVRHYHDLCGRFLGLADIHEQSPEFYAALEPRVLRELTLREEVPVYDCILVDEGQDFTRRMIEVLVRWNASGGEITVVSDPAQDIYGRWGPDTTRPLGEPAVEHLVDCYRNTAPIFALALNVLPSATRRVLGLDRLEITRPEDLGREGPPPELRKLDRLEDLLALLVGMVDEFRKEKRPLSELAVLYTDRGALGDFPALLRGAPWQAAGDPRFTAHADPLDPEPERDVIRGTLDPDADRDVQPTAPRPHFAEALAMELESRGVPAEWAARDFAAKAEYDITRERLTISTVHSAKGMDFHTVVLLGAESLSTRTGWDRERAEALLFTGITRARERLVMPYFARTGWIEELEARLD